MKVVLFGAGASFGSGEVSPKAPPLGKDLFEALVRLFPSTWGQIPESVKAEFLKDFEEGMGILIEKHGFAVAPLMQRMACFLSQFHLTSSSNNLYIHFFDFLVSRGLLKDTLVSTINYECLIENAVNLNNLKVGYFANPESGNQIAPIWKLHGSCNFKVTGLEATRDVSFSGVGVAFDGSIEPLNPSDVRRVYLGNTALYPAMCLYAKGKPITMSPSVIKKAQATWADEVQKAEIICVIGIHPNPTDAHIWSPITESDAQLYYVGNESAFKAWTSQYRADKANLHLGNKWNAVFDEVNNHLA